MTVKLNLQSKHCKLTEVSRVRIKPVKIIMFALYSLTEVVFKHFKSSCPLIDANGQFQITCIISDVSGQCMTIDEQLEVNTATDAGARLIKPTVDILANTTANVKALCQCKVQVNSL